MRDRSYVRDMVLVGVGFFVLGLVVGYVVPAVRQHAECDEQYIFVNDHYICSGGMVVDKRGYAETEETIYALFKEEYDLGNLEDAGVYFRDLRYGPVMGINEYADFAPASLLKVPLAIAYLNMAEEQPGLLLEKLSFETSREDYAATRHTPYFAPPEVIQRNTPYTIEELIERMVKYSDNYAYDVLYEYLVYANPEAIVTTYRELGIIRPTSDLEETITVKDVGTVFRILFNASYLSPENSEKLLGWLAEFSLKEGLVAGVPEGVAVASKFGERSFAGGSKQFHNCGIIYYPDNPYLLCVMTKGKEWGDLTRIVEKVSRIVYEEVDARSR